MRANNPQKFNKSPNNLVKRNTKIRILHFNKTRKSLILAAQRFIQLFLEEEICTCCSSIQAKNCCLKLDSQKLYFGQFSIIQYNSVDESRTLPTTCSFSTFSKQNAQRLCCRTEEEIPKTQSAFNRAKQVHITTS